MKGAPTPWLSSTDWALSALKSEEKYRRFLSFKSSKTKWKGSKKEKGYKEGQ
jgi:hypothetical protein